MNICVIPARGGSKRIPRKNIKLFHGKPIIAWSITAALSSEIFSHVVVSTDDEEIAEIARAFGAEAPFKRPVELASDMAGTVPAIAHAVRSCEKLGWLADNYCCIYPCAPFLRESDLLAGLKILEDSEMDFVYPVVEYSHPIQRAMLRSSLGEMSFLNPECELSRTQDMPKTYHDAGQFYWGRSSAWKAMRKMHSGGFGLVIPHWRSVDIDSEDDWKRAELLYKILQEF